MEFRESEKPEDQFVDVMRDAKNAAESKNPTDLRIVIEQARSIVDMLPKERQENALKQIDRYAEELAKIESSS